MFHICEAERQVLKEKVKPTATKKGTAYSRLWVAFNYINKSTKCSKFMENLWFITEDRVLKEKPKPVKKGILIDFVTRQTVYSMSTTVYCRPELCTDKNNLYLFYILEKPVEKKAAKEQKAKGMVCHQIYTIPPAPVVYPAGSSFNLWLIIVIHLLLLFTEDRVLKEIQEPAKKGIIVR